MIRKISFLLVLLLGVTYTNALSCTNLTANVSRYQESSRVLALQNFLYEKGYLKATPNGYFGNGTFLAVKLYQKSKGLDQVGVAGPATRKLIKEESCQTSPVAVVTQTTPILTTPSKPTYTQSPVSVTPSPSPAPTSPIVTPTQPVSSPVTPVVTPSPIAIPTPVVTPSAPYTLSAATLIADKQRTPLGQAYNDGTVILQAGEQKKVWNGSAWVAATNPGSYVQGSMHATVSLPDKSMLAYDFTSTTTQIHYDSARNKWVAQFLQYASPLGSLSQTKELSINALPGNSVGEHYEPLTLTPTDNYLYMALQRLVFRPEAWTRADGQAGSGYGWTCESHMVRSPLSNPTNFTFMGAIGTKSNYSALLQSSGKSFPDMPLYYACAPRCIALSDSKVVCALRGSADDDDGYRPLDPAKILNAPTEVPQTGSFAANKIANTIYAPPVQANKYYVPKNTVEIPPLMMALSNNGGASWEHKLIASKGGVDSHFAYDKANNLLVLAYGGLTYPRKGVAVQWSRDEGATWSEPLVISDGYTTGTAFVVHTGPKQFEIVYDVLDRYIEFSESTKAMINDGYRIYTKTLKIN